jgi:general secretion pathway protein L
MSGDIGTSGYITLLPNSGQSCVPYWQVQDGEIIADGLIHLGSDAAGSNEVNFPPESAAMPVMVLVPATGALVSWSAIGDLAPRQAETAARISAIQESLGRSEDLHVVSSAGGDGQITIARMSASYLQCGLDILKEQGLDPDILLPVGLAIPPPAAGYVKAKIGDEQFLRGARSVLPDEPALITHIVGGAPVAMLDLTQTEAALVAALSEPAINMRAGAFAKRRARGRMNSRQWKILAWLLLAGLLASLLLALATWAKYDRAIAREDTAALSAIQKIVPGASNVADGQKSLSQELSKRGVAGQQVTKLAASAFAIVQQLEAVTIRDIRYNGDGIIAFTLAAPTIDNINQALLIMQKQGYKVTATPRQDASGVAMADISMRAQ